MSMSRIFVVVFASILTVTSLVLMILHQSRNVELQIAVAANHQEGIFVIDNRHPENLTYHDIISRHNRPISWSPDGEWIVSHSSLNPKRNSIIIARANGSERRQLVDNGNLNLFPSWSPDGRWIVYVSIHDFQVDLYRIRPDGSEQQYLITGVHPYSMPSWSPDSRWIAVGIRQDTNWDIYRLRPDGSYMEQMTTNPEFDGNPLWSPDGNWIAYVANVGRDDYLYIMQADGSDKRKIGGLDDPSENPMSWSPDSREIVFESLQGNIYRVQPTRDAVQQITSNSRHDFYPRWSPDGQWIAFLRMDEEGLTRLFKMRPDGSDMQAIFDYPVVGSPIWSPIAEESTPSNKPIMFGFGIMLIIGTLQWRN